MRNIKTVDNETNTQKNNKKQTQKATTPTWETARCQIYLKTNTFYNNNNK